MDASSPPLTAPPNTPSANVENSLVLVLMTLSCAEMSERGWLAAIATGLTPPTPPPWARCLHTKGLDTHTNTSDARVDGVAGVYLQTKYLNDGFP